MTHRPRGQFCGRTRREFLWQAGGGFGALPLVSLLANDGQLSGQASGDDKIASSLNPLSPKPPHFAPKAKSVIFLFMYGGPSHIDTFDYKPELDKLDGKIDRLVESVAEMKGRVMASPTTWQLLGIVITTWTAGAAIVFALGRGLKP